MMTITAGDTTNIIMDLKNSGGRTLEAILGSKEAGDPDVESDLTKAIEGYMKDSQLNTELGKQLLYRVSIIHQMEEQGQFTNAVAYLNDMRGYISAPAVLQQGLITKEAQRTIDAKAQRWIDKLQEK